jgi:outer membrane PBP1 activator LpoA protein
MRNSLTLERWDQLLEALLAMDPDLMTSVRCLRHSKVTQPTKCQMNRARMSRSMAMEAKQNHQVSLLLPEWTVASAQTHPILAGFSFEDNLPARQTAQQLTKEGKIILNEFASGLEIRTTSVVGVFAGEADNHHHTKDR